MNETLTVTIGTANHEQLERANAHFWQLSLRRALTDAERHAWGHIRAQLERLAPATLRAVASDTVEVIE